jgi:hypothetical protein
MAFNTLFTERKALSTEQLEHLLDAREADVVDAVTELEESGQLLREEGMIVGVSGLSVVQTRHELIVNGVSRWTWCPWDALGIATLLGGIGEVKTSDPETHRPIAIHFTDSEIGPDAIDSVLLYPSEPENCVTVLEWCPIVNIFENSEAARSWMARNSVEGTIQDLWTASQASADSYRSLLDQQRPHPPLWQRLLWSLRLPWVGRLDANAR